MEHWDLYCGKIRKNNNEYVHIFSFAEKTIMFETFKKQILVKTY